MKIFSIPPNSATSLRLLKWPNSLNYILLAIHCFVAGLLYVMLLYGYLYSASHRRLFIGDLSVTGMVKKMVFKLRRDASDIPCGIKLRSAGGVSFQSVGPIAAKAWFWDREIRDQ